MSLKYHILSCSLGYKLNTGDSIILSNVWTMRRGERGEKRKSLVACSDGALTGRARTAFSPDQ